MMKRHLFLSLLALTLIVAMMPLESMAASAPKTTINGRRTLKNYLRNALVPCGRTLYIYGGGWGSTDFGLIGYQASWARFFKNHANLKYNRSKYNYKYGKGLDCSGFVGWTLYNTLYTTSQKKYLVRKSTKVAAWYAKKGWAVLRKKGSDKTFRPGDVVSLAGHVYISLGQYSDGSVLLIHSTTYGVQISGTPGIAASKARRYMKKYFPGWPFGTKSISNWYKTYVGKARWRVKGIGCLLSDPDGIQKMSPDKAMKCIMK